MPVRVYLSYAPADEAFASRLRDDLRAAGEDVETSSPELDTLDLTTSSNLERLNQMLGQRDTVVAVLSPDALASTRVNRELYIASGRAESGAMHAPVVVTARPVGNVPLPHLWSQARRLDAQGDPDGTAPALTKILEGTEEEKPRGLAALVDGNGYSPRAIWDRFGYHGAIIVVAAIIALLSFGLPWFGVGIACADQGCSLKSATIAPGPNDVDGYYLAADKHVNVSTGVAQIDTPGSTVQNGYATNDGIFDPHLPGSVTEGTQTVVVGNFLTFTTAPTLTFGFSPLRFFLPLALIMLLVPLLVALIGFKPSIAKPLIAIPVALELALVLVYIAAAPESFHSSELIHFAPGPGSGTWLAALMLVIAIATALSIPTKPATQKI
jgi:hypothetical protein